MVGKQQSLFPFHARGSGAELAHEQLLLKELLLEPQGHRHAERGNAPGRVRQVGLEQSLEFHERLLVEDDVADVVERDARLAEAIGHRTRGVSAVVFLAREALFLGGGHDVTVHDQRRRGVMIEG